MKTRIILGFFLSAILLACKKDVIETPRDDPPVKVDTISSLEYFPLDSGNFWVYERYWLDTNGTIITSIERDTDYVMMDTMINGQVYHALYTHNVTGIGGTSYLRDSSGYLVSSNGYIVLSTDNFGDTLLSDSLSGWGAWYERCILVDGTMNVAAGSFDHIIDRERVDTYVSQPYPWGSPRTNHHYFAKGTGMIWQEGHLSVSPHTLVRELVEFHVR